MDYSLTKKRIQECMEEHNDSLGTLAKKLNINKSTICRWFNGELKTIKSNIIVQLAEIYKVNISWLLGESDRKEIENFNHSQLRIEIDDMMKDCSMEDLEKVKTMVQLFVKK